MGTSCIGTACNTFTDSPRFGLVPGPLANLRFTKLDLGHVPIRFSKVDVHKTPNDGIKLDMDLDWEGVCDIELDGARVPKIVSTYVIKIYWNRSNVAILGHRKGTAEGQAEHLALPAHQHHSFGKNLP